MLIPLDTLNDPRLVDYRSLKTTNLTRWSGRLIAEGRVVVGRLLESGLKVHSLLVRQSLVAAIETPLPEDLPVLVLPDLLAKELVGFDFHQGVLASADRPKAPALESLFANATAHWTMAACSRVTDPVNLATIIRLCTAFGASALLLETGCADPFSRRTVRVSMGNVFRLSIVEQPDLKNELMRLKTKYDYSLFATVLDENAEPLGEVQPPPRSIVVFGNEHDGLSQDWTRACDRKITIPMRGGTDSLNVAVAAGIFLYHFDAAQEPRTQYKTGGRSSC
jgi:tRNA G18 (ribose-2'-O)-methylase SpoU